MRAGGMIMLVLLGLTVSQMIDFDSQQNCQTGKVKMQSWLAELSSAYCVLYFSGGFTQRFLSQSFRSSGKQFGR